MMVDINISILLLVSVTAAYPVSVNLVDQSIRELDHSESAVIKTREAPLSSDTLSSIQRSSGEFVGSSAGRTAQTSRQLQRRSPNDEANRGGRPRASTFTGFTKFMRNGVDKLRSRSPAILLRRRQPSSSHDAILVDELSGDELSNSFESLPLHPGSSFQRIPSEEHIYHTIGPPRSHHPVTVEPVYEEMRFPESWFSSNPGYEEMDAAKNAYIKKFGFPRKPRPTSDSRETAEKSSSESLGQDLANTSGLDASSSDSQETREESIHM